MSVVLQKSQNNAFLTLYCLTRALRGCCTPVMWKLVPQHDTAAAATTFPELLQFKPGSPKVTFGT